MYRFKVGHLEIECATLEELEKLIVRYGTAPPLAGAPPPLWAAVAPPGATPHIHPPYGVDPPPTLRARARAPVSPKPQAPVWPADRDTLPLGASAILLGMSDRSLRKHVRNGRLPVVLDSTGQQAITRKDLARFAKRKYTRQAPIPVSRIDGCYAIRESPKNRALLVSTSDGRSGWVPKSIISANSEIQQPGDRGCIIWQSPLGHAILLKRPPQLPLSEVK